MSLVKSWRVPIQPIAIRSMNGWQVWTQPITKIYMNCWPVWIQLTARRCWNGWPEPIAKSSVKSWWIWIQLTPTSVVNGWHTLTQPTPMRSGGLAGFNPTYKEELWEVLVGFDHEILASSWYRCFMDVLGAYRLLQGYLEPFPRWHGNHTILEHIPQPFAPWHTFGRTFYSLSLVLLVRAPGQFSHIVALGVKF